MPTPYPLTIGYLYLLQVRFEGENCHEPGKVFPILCDNLRAIAAQNLSGKDHIAAKRLVAIRGAALGSGTSPEIRCEKHDRGIDR